MSFQDGAQLPSMPSIQKTRTTVRSASDRESIRLALLAGGSGFERHFGNDSPVLHVKRRERHSMSALKSFHRKCSVSVLQQPAHVQLGRRRFTVFPGQTTREREEEKQHGKRGPG